MGSFGDGLGMVWGWFGMVWDDLGWFGMVWGWFGAVHDPNCFLFLCVDRSGLTVLNILVVCWSFAGRFGMVCGWFVDENKQCRWSR